MDENDNIQLLKRVLDRQLEISALTAVRRSLGQRAEDNADNLVDLSTVAFGVDTNIVLRMAKADSKTTNLRDYLAASHTGPFIVPGQVVQEFWNSMAGTVDTVAKSIKKHYEELDKDIQRADPDGDFGNRFRDLISEFDDRYGYLYDPKTMTRFDGLFEMFADRAILSYVPRSQFHRLVAARSATKTPPGFKDSGDGDFFVWADFLLGLLRARSGGSEFSTAVLVTEDVKKDWSSGGSAHPILVAEVDALLGINFETWTLDRFNRLLERGA